MIFSWGWWSFSLCNFSFLSVFNLCIYLKRKQKIQKFARNRYRYNLDLWMVVDFLQISFLSQPLMFTPDLAWETCLHMSRVKTSSLNSIFKWGFLCLHWPLDVVLQQANKMQREAWGTAKPITGLPRQMRPYRFPYWGCYYKAEPQHFLHSTPAGIPNLVQVC